MLLEGEGLEVYWYQEGDREEFGEFPVISFGGDNDEEMRALRLGWQHGYYPERIEKGWHIMGATIEAPDWVLLFDRDYGFVEKPLVCRKTPAALRGRILSQKSSCRKSSVGGVWQLTSNGNGKGKTMAALAEVLEAGGIEVCQHFEGDGKEYGQLPSIVFEGDEAVV